MKQIVWAFRDEMFLFEVKLFWSLQDRLLPLSLRWLSEFNQFKFGLWVILKSGFKLPISTRHSSETEMSKMQVGSCNSKEGQPLQEGGAGPGGDPCQDQTGRRSSWGHASTDGHRMVTPAFCRPVASCCLLWASSLDCFVPGQVCFLCSSVFYWYNSSNESEVTPVSWLSAG